MPLRKMPFGPSLAEALGGTYDAEDAAVRFSATETFVRCGPTGKVQVVTDTPVPILLGTIGEGVETLARRFRLAVHRGLFS